MSQKSKSIAVVTLAVLVATAVLLGVSRRVGSSNMRYIEGAVSRGMDKFYSELKENLVAGSAKVTLLTQDLRIRLLANDRYKGYFPSFVTPQDIFIAASQVELGSRNLICVARLNQEILWGVDATGQSRRINDSEFRQWPHVALDRC
jgi:hypothetical protein